jgi:predicted anti-sigma-YlaC factor YlaD
MTCTTHKHIAAIDKLFLDGLAPWRFRRLRAHLTDCARCRAYYDKVALVWRAMGENAVPPQVRDALADDLIRNLEGKRPRPRWPRLLAAAAGAAALAVGVQLSGLPARLFGRPSGEFQVRGTAAARARGVRAFCLGVDASHETVVRGAAPSVRAGAPAKDGVGRHAAPSRLRCGLDDSLQFAYTLGEGPAEQLLLWGRDPDGALHWYAPAAGEGLQALTSGVVDEPLPASVRLRVHHRPGEVTVHALFTERPLSRAQVESAADPAGLAGVVDHQTLLLALE